MNYNYINQEWLDRETKKNTYPIIVTAVLISLIMYTFYGIFRADKSNMWLLLITFIIGCNITIFGLVRIEIVSFLESKSAPHHGLSKINNCILIGMKDFYKQLFIMPISFILCIPGYLAVYPTHLFINSLFRYFDTPITDKEQECIYNLKRSKEKATKPVLYSIAIFLVFIILIPVLSIWIKGKTYFWIATIAAVIDGYISARLMWYEVMSMKCRLYDFDLEKFRKESQK